jgi:hypothetical protein
VLAHPRNGDWLLEVGTKNQQRITNDQQPITVSQRRGQAAARGARRGEAIALSIELSADRKLMVVGHWLLVVGYWKFVA